MLLRLLVPLRCLACGASGATLCGRCRRGLTFLRGTCPRCALPAPCGRRCAARDAGWDRAVAAVAFDGPARALVHALKFGRHLAAADVMAAHVAGTLRSHPVAADAVLVPVPAQPRRARAQGFDHGVELARALGRRLDRPVARGLRRDSGSTTQVAAGSRAARRGGPGVTAHGVVPPQVVLVDDVHTTGATLDACARALRAAGAEEVVAVCHARTLPRRSSTL